MLGGQTNAGAMLREGETAEVYALEPLHFELDEAKSPLYFGPGNNLLHYKPSARVRLLHGSDMEALQQEVITTNDGVQGFLSGIYKLQDILPPLASDVIASSLAIVAGIYGEESLLFTTRSIEDVIFGYEEQTVVRLLDLVTEKLCSLIPLNITSLDGVCSEALEDLLGYYGISPRVSGVIDSLLDYDTMNKVNGEWLYETAPSAVLDELPLHRSSVLTGKEDFSQSNRLETYQGYSDMTCCAMVQCPPTKRRQPWRSPVPVSATLGLKFDPRTLENHPLIINSPVKRVLRLAPVMEDRSKTSISGVQSRTYGIDHRELQNSSISGSQSKFYMDGPTGLFNMTPCSNGVLRFISKPFFLDVEGPIMDSSGASIQSRVIIRTAQPRGTTSIQDYDSSYTLDMAYGIALQLESRLQVNIYIQEVVLGNYTLFSNLKAAQIPVAWNEEIYKADVGINCIREDSK